MLRAILPRQGARPEELQGLLWLRESTVSNSIYKAWPASNFPAAPQWCDLGLLQVFWAAAA